MSSFKEENSYSNILKRMSAFGGIQIFNAIISIVRGKFVAIFLGTAGMGISSLYNTSALTLQQLGSLGLNLALVKEVSAGKDNKDRLSHILSVALRLILLTSLFGAILCFILSPWLSRWTFGDSDHTSGFMCLSLFVGLSIGGTGYMALLQGLGEVKRLTKASLVGGLTGLFCGVPLYWLFGDKGIVPAMILMALSIFLFYYISYRKTTDLKPASFVRDIHRPIVRKLISLGLVLMIGSLAGAFTNYLINAFIRYSGGEETVGLFQASNSITNQYIGIIFSALALDYFPRLSAVVDNNSGMRMVVNRQIELVALLMGPISTLLILTSPLIIRILLTESFLPSMELMRWMGLGILLQSVTFPLGYIYVAKANKKIYLWTEVVLTNIIWLICSVLFFHLYGLNGLGISLVVRSAIDIVITYTINRRMYGFRFSGRAVLCVMASFVTGTACFLFSLLPGTLSVAGMCLSVVAAVLFSICYGIKVLRRKNEDISLDE